MATLEEEYKNYQQTQNTDQINSMYDAQKQSQLAGLESAYNQSLSDAQAAKDALPRQYQARANDLAVQYERQRRNLNQQAAANGLNTGAGSQMHLALGSNYGRDYGNIRTAQQQAIDAADRGIRDLQSAYQNQVQQAVANNDYQRAQALLAEYKNQYQRQIEQAQTLASYGDFSAYLNIPGYSQGQVDNMRNTWIASNPGLAYNTGAITAEQYYAMTGQWPAGYSAPATGGGYYPASGSGGGNGNGETTGAETVGGGDGDANGGTDGAGNGILPYVLDTMAVIGSGGAIPPILTGPPAGAGAGSSGSGESPNSAVYKALKTSPNAKANAVAADYWLKWAVQTGQITEEQARKIKHGD